MSNKKTRRNVLSTVAAGTVTAMAGCLGVFDDSEVTARCSTRGTFSENLRATVLDGDKQVAIAVAVEHAQGRVTITDRNGNIVADIPLDGEHRSSSLESEVKSSFADDFGEEAEIYAVPIGKPPQHGIMNVSLVDQDGNTLGTNELRFNCYTPDGELP